MLKEKPEPIRDPNWTFKTGRYAGERLGDVIYCNPDYVSWLIANTNFDVHSELFIEAEQRYRDGLDMLFRYETEDHK